METITNTEVTTRAAAGEAEVLTNLKIDWTDMTPEDIRALAQQALIVKLQGQWRRNGIPAGEHEVKAADFKPGTRQARTPLTPAQIAQKLTPEQKAELLKMLQG